MTAFVVIANTTGCVCERAPNPEKSSARVGGAAAAMGAITVIAAQTSWQQTSQQPTR
jgi:hypothetical protein